MPGIGASSLMKVPSMITLRSLSDDCTPASADWICWEAALTTSVRLIVSHIGLVDVEATGGVDGLLLATALDKASP